MGRGKGRGVGYAEGSGGEAKGGGLVMQRGRVVVRQAAGSLLCRVGEFR